MSCHVWSPPTTGPGAPMEVATNEAMDATIPSSSRNSPRPPSAVARGRAAGRTAATLEEDEATKLAVAGIRGPDAGQVEVGRGVARREASAGRVPPEEDVLAPGHGASHLDDGVDVAREDEVCPAGDERYVALRIVEDPPPVRPARQERMQSQSQLAAVEPVERNLRAQEFLRDVEADRVLELVRTPVEGPHLEHEAFCLGASKDVLRQDLEVAG